MVGVAVYAGQGAAAGFHADQKGALADGRCDGGVCAEWVAGECGV